MKRPKRREPFAPARFPRFERVDELVVHGERDASGVALREHGFEVEALHEPRPGDTAENPSYYDFVDVEWAQKWPAEEIWVARKS